MGEKVSCSSEPESEMSDARPNTRYSRLCEMVMMYCGNVLHFHVRHSLDPSASITDDENLHLQQWAMHSDPAIARSVSVALGFDGLDAIAAHFVDAGDFVKAARAKWCKQLLTGPFSGLRFLFESRDLLLQSDRTDNEKLQIEWVSSLHAHRSVPFLTELSYA